MICDIIGSLCHTHKKNQNWPEVDSVPVDWIKMQACLTFFKEFQGKYLKFVTVELHVHQAGIYITNIHSEEINLHLLPNTFFHLQVTQW